MLCGTEPKENGGDDDEDHDADQNSPEDDLAVRQ
jgi:hypothetical protein